LASTSQKRELGEVTGLTAHKIWGGGTRKGQKKYKQYTTWGLHCSSYWLNTITELVILVCRC